MKPKPLSCPAGLGGWWPQRGFTLTELMISIALGLLVVVALIALFANISRTNTEMAKTNSLIENGRFTMQLLRNDIAHAGFWGAHVPQFDDLTLAGVPGDAPLAVPDPCLPYSTPWNAGYLNGILGIPVQVYGATPPSGLGCVTNFATNRQANTDVLVVRHAETCLPGAGNCEADTTGKLYFQASLCELENATPYKLATSGFSLHKRDCVGTGTPPALPITAGTLADKRKFLSNIYYIRDWSVDVGDGIPTLMRSTFDLSGGTLAHQAAQPLIEGIEGFRVELGVDNFGESGADITTPFASVPPGVICTDNTGPRYKCSIDWQDADMTVATNRGDGSPDGAFVSCTDAAPCTVDQLINVTAVKLYVLARAKERTPGYTDDKTYSLGSQTMCSTGSTDAACSLKVLDPVFKRHVFSTTVRLTNISGRRDTP